MAARYILAALAAVFLVLGALRSARAGAPAGRQGRTWLTVGAIFALVSVILFARDV